MKPLASIPNTIKTKQINCLVDEKKLYVKEYSRRKINTGRTMDMVKETQPGKRVVDVARRKE